MIEWEPATEAETAMREALSVGDQEQYFRVLASSELVLPVAADVLTGQPSAGWGTWSAEGRTHVLAFTSAEALTACLAEHAGSFRIVSFHDLAAGWPDLEWWLAVDPGLPIEAYLPAWFVAQVSRGDVRLPGRTLGARARIEHSKVLQARASQTGRRDASGAEVADPGYAGPPATGPSTGSAHPPTGSAHPPTSSARPPTMRGVASPNGVRAGEPGEAARAGEPPEPWRRPRRGDDPAGPRGRDTADLRPGRDTPGLRPGRDTPDLGRTGDTADLSRAREIAEIRRGRGTVGPRQPRQPDPREAMTSDSHQAPAPEPAENGEPWRAGEREPWQPADAAADTGTVGTPRPATAGAAEPVGAFNGVPLDFDFEPANQVEENLLDAAGEGSTDSFLSTLLLSKVLLPGPESDPMDNIEQWRTEQIEGQPYIVVFTSPAMLARHLGDDATATWIKFTQLIHAWPSESMSFAVNPGTRIGASLPGSQIVALASWADEVGLTDERPEPEPPAPAPEQPVRSTPPTSTGPVVMQKTISAEQVHFHLERGYDRVSGFVHRASEVAHLHTPVELYAALGLGYSGSPFKPDDDEMFVLRWTAHRANLYRIPYGGQHEEAMRAMRGWVIERTPFRGNGFAPSDSRDVIAEFKVDSVRLPHGAEMWQVDRDGNEKMIAMFDADGPRWLRVGDE